MFPNLSKTRIVNEYRFKAESASTKVNALLHEFHKLQDSFEKACLINQALLEIVQDKLGVSDSELEAKILEVDLRDGAADGKMNGIVIVCSGCGRKVNGKKGSCFYCGSALNDDQKFDL